MAGLLDGKVAVVTGGANGIGLAAAERFIAEGARVVIGDIEDAEGEAAARRLGPAAAYVHADVTSEADIARLVATAEDRFGKLDVMYNNAGGLGDPAPVQDLEGRAFDSLMALVTRSVMLGHKHASRQFIKQGSPGVILSTLSIAGLQGGWSPMAYTVAKHAIVGIVRQAAAELGPHGIRCNGIAPGAVLTTIQARTFNIPPERADAYTRFLIENIGPKLGMGRFGQPQDVAGVATFLASDMGAYVSGVIIPVDGGVSSVAQSGFGAEITELSRQFREAMA